MSLQITALTLGPLQTNTYLLTDTVSKDTVVVDPAYGSNPVLSEIQQNGWNLTQIWLTHAHFDHLMGVPAICDVHNAPIKIGLHPLDIPLYQAKGNAAEFGIPVDDLPDLDISFSHQQTINIGEESIEILHSPGHTPGHVIFYSKSANSVCCGDLIFYHSIGRTDLPGGSYPNIIKSIKENILTLPPDTRLLSGHGPATSVTEELKHNPFL